MKRFALFFAAAALSALIAQDLRQPNKKESFHFAVIGDTGTGERRQYEVGSQLASFHKVFSFDTVLMMGDNIYGSHKPKDYVKKFEYPYSTLLSGGVKFYATLGNHDDSAQVSYRHFNMNGHRYFSWQPRPGVRFFSLDSNSMDKQQVQWVEKELAAAGNDWKIVFFHHPLYSSGGKHGSDVGLRSVLEPIFVKHHVSMVLSGHDHFYERVKPQRGITYFVIGGSAKLRDGDANRSSFTATAFDRDNSFVLMEIDGDTLSFQAISRTGQTVDQGTVRRAASAETADAAN